jgi:hypothetical protein
MHIIYLSHYWVNYYNIYQDQSSNLLTAIHQIKEPRSRHEKAKNS